MVLKPDIFLKIPNRFLEVRNHLLTAFRTFLFVYSCVFSLDCGTNISSLDFGVITSPNFPNNYDGPAKNLASKTCNWFIRVRPNHQILLNFELFSVEGEQMSECFIGSEMRMTRLEEKLS